MGQNKKIRENRVIVMRATVDKLDLPNGRNARNNQGTVRQNSVHFHRPQYRKGVGGSAREVRRNGN